MNLLKLLLFSCSIAILCNACSFILLEARKDPFYSLVLKKDADQPFALYAQGQMLLDQGRFADAAPYFKRLTKVDPKHAGGWLSLGKCSLELQQYRNAESAFDRALALNHSAEAQFGSALAKLMQGKVDPAKKMADQLRSQLEDSPQLMNLYGDIAIVEGRTPEALEYYRKSIELDPSQEAIQKRLRDLNNFLANR
jgi:predicted Zn-dependent protease